MQNEMQINLGDVVSIFLKDRVKEYTTSVQEVTDPFFSVYSFIDEYASIKENVRIYIKKSDCLWTFEAAFRGIQRDGEMQLMQFERLTSVGRLQRRGAFRLQRLFNVSVTLDGYTVECRARDISETGIRLDFPHSLPVGKMLTCKFTLGGIEFSMPITVRGVQITEERGERRYFLGCQFDEISPRESRELAKSYIKGRRGV